MKSTFLSYLLAIMGFVTPFAGLHRFYLGRPLSGMFYLLTWGFFGIGTFLDIIRMPIMVEFANQKLLFLRNLAHYQKREFHKPPSHPQKTILELASKNNGILTVNMLSLKSDLNLNQAKGELEYLFKSGFCQKDVDVDGVEIYIFQGFTAKSPL